MKNKIIFFLRKIVFAFGIIYGLDVCLKNTNLMIPINMSTLALTIFLGIPGLLSIIAIFYLIK